MLSWLWGDPLPVGTSAPDFTLKDESGRPVRLQDLRGNNVILVWYPGDDTPTCRTQLCELRDVWATVKQRGILVFGVNPQTAESHAKFRQKFQFPFPLLVDEGQRVGELYKTRSFLAKRTVYLIGKDGVIRYARRGKPSPDEILQAAE